MNKAIVFTNLLFFVISLMLVITDFNSSDCIFYPIHQGLPNECPDFSNHFEHSNSICFDGLYLKGSTHANSGNCSDINYIIPCFDSIITDSQTKCVWHPPKLS